MSLAGAVELEPRLAIALAGTFGWLSREDFAGAITAKLPGQQKETPRREGIAARPAAEAAPAGCGREPLAVSASRHDQPRSIGQARADRDGSRSPQC